MNNVKAIQKLTETELKLNAGSKSSWHDMYSGSAYIFVGGLDYGLTEGDVISIFSQYGEIVNINLVYDRKTGKSKGFCFLAYEDQRSTILAVDNLNGIRICGRTIRVDHVAEYRRPKDEHGNEIIEKGCAPKTPTPSPSPSPDSLNGSPQTSHKHKHKKEKKKLKKKKVKKKAKRRGTVSDSENSDDTGRLQKDEVSVATATVSHPRVMSPLSQATNSKKKLFSKDGNELPEAGPRERRRQSRSRSRERKLRQQRSEPPRSRSRERRQPSRSRSRERRRPSRSRSRERRRPSRSRSRERRRPSRSRSRERRRPSRSRSRERRKPRSRSRERRRPSRSRSRERRQLARSS